ncbi:MAG: hypothetical protein D6679_04665 [Candidatus Hydrogenedentota bacterium]|nr:MAG: hypothetical protein D6679_04665 [Candidatus Hydrogenedentota bacterium]
MNESFREFLASPVLRILGFVLLAVAFLAGSDRLAANSARVRALRAQAEKIERFAKEYVRLRSEVNRIHARIAETPAAVKLVQDKGTASGISIRSVSSLPETEGESRISLSLRDLEPDRLFTYLASLETSGPGIVVRELTIRRSLDRNDRLDADVILGYLSGKEWRVPRKEERDSKMLSGGRTSEI